MNDAEFRRRAHALLERCVVREEATGTKWTGELRALLAAGAAHRTCNCAYPPAHRPDCPDHGRMWPAVNIDLPPARKD